MWPTCEHTPSGRRDSNRDNSTLHLCLSHDHNTPCNCSDRNSAAESARWTVEWEQFVCLRGREGEREGGRERGREEGGREGGRRKKECVGEW